MLRQRSYRGAGPAQNSELHFTYRSTGRSGTIDLRSGRGRVTAILSVPAPYTLTDLHISNVRFEGVAALTTALSSDGRAIVATFDASRVTTLRAGQNVTVSLAADIVKDGVEDLLWASTTATVLK